MKVVYFILIVKMSVINTLILDQNKLYSSIKGAYQAYKSRMKNNFTVGAINSKLISLETKWRKYQENDIEIQSLKTDKDEDQDYFKSTEFHIDNVEDMLIDERGKFMNKKIQLLQTSGINNSHHENNVINTVDQRKLPVLPLPKFNGNWKDWISFRDLFSELVVKSHRTAAEKLYYLKDSLTDEPYFLI